MSSCAVADCSKPARAHGYCNAHAHRFRRYGDPLGKPPRPSLLQVVVSRIDIRGDDECWHWTGTIAHGYGRINVGPGSPRNVHCVVYELFVGEIPDGSQIDHVCHNADANCCGGDACLHRRCVNPRHLEAVTQQENQRRQGSRQRLAHGATCPKGHPWAENEYTTPAGKRVCKSCRRIRVRDWKRANRQRTRRKAS